MQCVGVESSSNSSWDSSIERMKQKDKDRVSQVVKEAYEMEETDKGHYISL